jgi:nucleoside-diphosphate-sugar epimerase
MWLGKTSVPLTFVHTSDLAAYLAVAFDADAEDAERIEVGGWNRPVSVLEVATSLLSPLGSQPRCAQFLLPSPASSAPSPGPSSP